MRSRSSVERPRARREPRPAGHDVENLQDTRRRIAEAAVELHGTLGPARTTVSAVAERAGVQRHTVYQHFPTEDELYAAYPGLFARRYPVARRRRLGSDREPARVLRDRHLVGAVESTLAPFDEHVERAARSLSSGWGVRAGRRRVLSAAVRHAIDVATWRSLVELGGISRRQAFELMVALVESAVGRA